jgi:hypothetical protein
MTDIWAELRPKLEFFSRPFPHEAVALACRHRNEVAPHLIAVLEAIAENPEPARDGEYMLHLYAMHLLAHWRDTRAYRPLAKLGHNGDKTIEDILGDVVTETYGRMLASVCDGDLEPLKQLAEDREACIWSRVAALTALGVRVLEGDGDRDEAIAYLSDLGNRQAQRLRSKGRAEHELEILDNLVAVATDIGAVSMIEAIRGWFADGLLNPRFAEEKWILDHIVRPLEVLREEMRKFNNGYVSDVVHEMAWWSGFKEEEDLHRERAELFADRHPDTYIRTAPKVGRNDPCPCGSGKKYKKCHGADA